MSVRVWNGAHLIALFGLLFMCSPEAEARAAASDTLDVWMVMEETGLRAAEAFEHAWSQEARVIRFSAPETGTPFVYTFERLSRVSNRTNRLVLVDEGVTLTVDDYTGLTPAVEYAKQGARGLLSFSSVDSLSIEINGAIDANARWGHIPFSSRGSGWDDTSEASGDSELRSHHAIHVTAADVLRIAGGTYSNAWFGVLVTNSKEVVIEDIFLAGGTEQSQGPRRARGTEYVGGYLNAAVALHDVERARLRRISSRLSSEVIDLNGIGHPVEITDVEGWEIWEGVLEISGAPEYSISHIRGTDCVAVLRLIPYAGSTALGAIDDAIARYTSTPPEWLQGEDVVPFKVHSNAVLTNARVEVEAGATAVRQFLRQARVEGNHVTPFGGMVDLTVEAAPGSSFPATYKEVYGAGEHSELITHYGGTLQLRLRAPIGQGRRAVWSYGAGSIYVLRAEDVEGGGVLLGAGTLAAGPLEMWLGSAIGFTHRFEQARGSDVRTLGAQGDGQHRPHLVDGMLIAADRDVLRQYDDGEEVRVWRNRGEKLYAGLGGATPIGSVIYREGMGLELPEGASMSWRSLTDDELDMTQHRVTTRFRLGEDVVRERRVFGFGGLAPYRVVASVDGLRALIRNAPTLTINTPLDPETWYAVTVEVEGTTFRLTLLPERGSPVRREVEMSEPFGTARGAFEMGGLSDGRQATGTMWLSEVFVGSGGAVLDATTADEEWALMPITDQPLPLSPLDGVAISLPACFSWSAVAGAWYELRVQGPQGNQTFRASGTTACLGSDVLTPGEAYTWHVVARTASGSSNETPARLVAFDPATRGVDHTVLGRTGWRIVGIPTDGLTVDSLAAMNLVAGVPGYYPDFGAATLYTGYGGGGWEASIGAGEPLARGQAVLWYHYDSAFTPEGRTESVSRSQSHPFVLRTDREASVLPVDVALNTQGDRLTLIGNPFGVPLDVRNVSSWSGGSAVASKGRAYIWDPSRSTWAFGEQAGEVAPWQGFAVRAKRAGGTLTIPSPGLAGATAKAFEPESPRIGFQLLGEHSLTGQPLEDHAFEITYLPKAEDGEDEWDEEKLRPLSDAYVLVGAVSTPHTSWKSSDSRSLSLTDQPVEIGVESAGAAQALRLQWTGIETLPEDWSLRLRDMETGQEIDLRERSSYEFDDAPRPSNSQEKGAVDKKPSGLVLSASSKSRFALVVEKGEMAVVPFRLEPVRPNPSSSAASLTYSLPSESAVLVRVLDIRGRVIMRMEEEKQHAGHHTVSMDTSEWAPGVYVIHLRADSGVLSGRLVVVR